EYSGALNHGQRAPTKIPPPIWLPPVLDDTIPLAASPGLRQESNSGSVRMHNVVIIGSGCAGLTAAIYAARANLKPLVIDGHEPGGQLTLTTLVENFPGFPEGILGPELIDNMRKQAQRFGAEFKSGAVSEVDLSRRPFRIGAGKDTYETKTLIVAAGASARLLGLPAERNLMG